MFLDLVSQAVVDSTILCFRPDKKIPLNGRNKKLNAQNSRFSSSTQCLKLFDQLPFPQKQRSIRFNVQECEIIPEIHTYREGSMSSYKTPANCYPDSLTKESTLSSSSCQFSAYPSSLMSSELTFFDNDSSNSVECSLGLFSDFELPSPPTPYPFKDYEAEKEQLENEDAVSVNCCSTSDVYCNTLLYYGMFLIIGAPISQVDRRPIS